MNQLLLVEEQGWERYAFAHEPLVGKLNHRQQQMYYKNASECGASLACDIRNKYQGKSIKECAELEGAKVKIEDIRQEGYQTMFATFEEPDLITIFKDNADRTDDLINTEKLSEKIGTVKTSDLLLAHELFHYIELRTPDIYTKQKHLTLFKIGRLENRSRIMCLEEVGAMAFAKELTGISCSPYLYDVLMLYACNPQKAKQQYKTMMKFFRRQRDEMDYTISNC